MTTCFRKSAFAIAALGLVLVFSFSGCGNEDTAKPNGPELDAKGMSGNADDQALFIIDGKPLRASFVRDTVLVMAKTFELAKHKVNPKTFNAWANRMAMRTARNLVSVMLIDAELDRIGFKATPESDAATLLRYRRMTRTSASTLDDMARQFGDLGDFFRAQFARESRFTAYMKSKGIENVSEGEIDSFLRNATKKYEKCQAINKMANARINQAWSELKKGVKWDVVATNYTEDALLEKTYADNWRNWQVAPLEKISPPELAAALKPLSAGGYTKPVLTEEGLVIARVNELEKGVYDLARILVRSAIDYEIPNRETAIKVIRRNKSEDFQKKLVEALKKKAVVEFPLGTNFVYKIWK